VSAGRQSGTLDARPSEYFAADEFRLEMVVRLKLATVLDQLDQRVSNPPVRGLGLDGGQRGHELGPRLSDAFPRPNE
jgi:hypothetical protein